ncbi:type I-D CRISPR-associated helicase Cas3' [Leptothoe spongobia]|uniref:Type I-D CRISPR-associated helicase Cas3 n=1 Tax=Leptothoe spongobia TAU-MAC 1115 TaxID=1967444 RepID=A0A947DDP9_9CYAN|nr:type I-D CRISPR-associated helicase Cas3' [Leptothoe spongobia]MBT9314674.1 type I-D CRISPR-associated helicase Cas3' [Leptothoe spongobia TAU-MAC 1115]
MKVLVKPLYSQVNVGIGACPLGCQQSCQVTEKSSTFQPITDCSCPLSSHQAETAAAVFDGEADIIFNTSVTGDGKSLAASLPILLDSQYRMVGLYPTNELVEDQLRGQQDYHEKFGLNPQKRIDLLYGQELARRVKANDRNRFRELELTIQHKPVLLTNPDLFHLMLHFRYRNAAYDNAELPMLMATFPDYWVFDEFHIFGPHQEAAVLNSLCFIRASAQGKRKFLFTSATPKTTFIKQLESSGFKVKSISGQYASEAKPGYRPILQPVELEFVKLRPQQGILDWLQDNVGLLQNLLLAEAKGRGLLILNSVAQAGRVVRLLKTLLPDNFEIAEISGRIDRQERRKTQEKLKDSPHPVLVVGTSAVDVGVDFKIHLLIFESSNSATVIQRLGRLGRHQGFQKYHAFCLLPGHAPWIYSRLTESLGESPTIERQTLNDAIRSAFEEPKEFEQYRQQWGALQAQGMLTQIQRDRNNSEKKVMEPVCDRILSALTPVYSEAKLEGARKCWHAKGNNSIGKATQEELLRFRGGTTLQAAVWDDHRFYTYDLLRLLPYTHVEIIEESDFLTAAEEAGYGEEFFSYAQVYIKVQQWLDERLHIRLSCNRDSSELKCCDLTQIKGLRIEEHPQIEIVRALSQKKVLAFLIPLGKRQPHWDIVKALRLSPLFGLHHLTDASEQSYACAFNQDALLLKAFEKHHRLTKFCRQAGSLFF